MKKRIVMSLLLGLSIFMLASCGEVNQAPEDEKEQIEEDQDKDEEAEEDEHEDEPEEEDNSSAVIYAFSRNANSENIYFFDSDGNLAYSTTRTELAKGVDEEYGKYLETRDGFASSSLVAYGDGFLFFKDYYLDESTGNYTNRYYAIKSGGSDVYTIWNESSDISILSADYYNGRFYIDHTNGYGSDGAFSGYDEAVFVFDPDDNAFVQETCEIQNVLEAINEAGCRPRSTTSATPGMTDQVACYTRAFNESGYLLAYSPDSGYQIVNKKGKMQELQVSENASYIECYDANHLFYLEWDDNYYNATAYIYDIHSGTATPITDGENPIGLLGKSGAKYYYSINRSEEYGLTHNYIYEYDADNGKNTIIYDVEKTPGVNLMPGTECFTIAGDNIFFLGFENGDETWMGYSLSHANSSVVSTGIKEKHLDIFDLGTVGYMSNTGNCPDCGTPLEMIYCEYLKIDDSLSEKADEINEYLLNAAEFTVAIDDNVLGQGESCEDHLENPKWYQITNGVGISGAEIIDDRYLAVSMNGYWYAGGAHGMPSRFQYLFDLETGEVKNLTDFYEGSEEEFKELIAEKTKEDYLSYEYYGNPYFAMDEDEAYEDALGYISLTAASADFTQDGIYYYYPPYMMGPYASGYIDVFVSYEELLGRPTLAE